MARFFRYRSCSVTTGPLNELFYLMSRSRESSCDYECHARKRSFFFSPAAFIIGIRNLNAELLHLVKGAEILFFSEKTGNRFGQLFAHLPDLHYTVRHNMIQVVQALKVLRELFCSVLTNMKNAESIKKSPESRFFTFFDGFQQILSRFLREPRKPKQLFPFQFVEIHEMPDEPLIVQQFDVLFTQAFNVHRVP